MSRQLEGVAPVFAVRTPTAAGGGRSWGWQQARASALRPGCHWAAVQGAGLAAAQPARAPLLAVQFPRLKLPVGRGRFQRKHFWRKPAGARSALLSGGMRVVRQARADHAATLGNRWSARVANN